MVNVKTNITWIKDFGQTPIIGHFFVLMLATLPCAIFSLAISEIFFKAEADFVFTRIMYITVPLWNIFLWIRRINIYIFFLLSWLIFSLIVIVRHFSEYKFLLPQNSKPHTKPFHHNIVVTKNQPKLDE
jgi:hypothetical protein